jgi:hypothetical protein
MEPTLTPEQQALLGSISRDLDRGVRPNTLIDRLTNAGMDKGQAIKLVYGMEEAVTTAKQKRARKDIIQGAIWCGGGCLVTIFTYAAASRGGGGGYVVAWGAILFGGWQMIRGAMGSN